MIPFTEQDIEEASRNKGGDSNAGVVSDKLGVDRNRRESSIERVADCGGEQEAGHDKRLHPLRRFVVGILQPTVANRFVSNIKSKKKISYPVIDAKISLIAIKTYGGI